ncbi:MAG: peptidoglycan DD-metalloendopeptidase family protein [Candidatus Peregrinibacteria bacterium]|nr:peptidoglycan DD-metalloendopeptidase family protein [Candidatus Peregrinibacteria bacterium]
MPSPLQVLRTLRSYVLPPGVGLFLLFALGSCGLTVQLLSMRASEEEEGILESRISQFRIVQRMRITRRTSLPSTVPLTPPRALPKATETHAAAPSIRIPPLVTGVPTLTVAAVSESAVQEVPHEAASPAGFPPFVRAVYPVPRVPNWGAMRTSAEWNRTYGELAPSDFVPIPAYNMNILTTSMDSLTHPITEESIPKITAKLYYSTRFFGAYDIDAGEFTGQHPGIDLKLAFGTPIGAVAGGKVYNVQRNDTLGLHVIVEHHRQEETFFSVYGHLEAVAVRLGDTVTPGQFLGTVGLTGNTSGPHLHLQIDRDRGGTPYTPYATNSILTPGEAEKVTVSPVRFFSLYREG